MQFNSWIFIIIFLPISLISYYFINKYIGKKAGYVSLLTSNIVFYGYASIEFLVF